MSWIKDQYRQAFAFFRGSLWLYFKNSTIAFFVILLIFYAAGVLHPPIADSMIAYFQSVIEQSEIVSDAGQISIFNLLANNLRASALSMAYGIIPFLYLPALPIGMNAAVLGALAAYYQLGHQSMLLLAAGILPHGIFEIPALLIAFAGGLYLCRTVTATILHRETDLPLSAAILSLVRVYITMILPLLIVASIVESYITPLCMALLM